MKEASDRGIIMQFDDCIVSIGFKSDDIFFFISYGLFLIYSILSVSFYLKYIEKYWKYIFIVCILLLIIQEIVNDQISKNSAAFLMIAFLLMVLIMRVSGGWGQNTFAVSFFYAYCARNIPFKKIALITLIISISLLFFVVSSAQLGIIKNYIFEEERRREYLGFLYALYGPTLIANITALYIYLREKSFKIIGAVVLFVVNLFFYLKTDSRLCFYTSVLLICSALFLKWKPDFLQKHLCICWFLVLSFIISAFLAIGFTVFYNQTVPWQSRLNDALGGRIAMGKESLFMYGVKLFGIKGIRWIGNGLNMEGFLDYNRYLYVDSAYVQILQQYGILVSIILLALLTYVLYRCYMKHEYYLLIIFSFIAFHSIIDDLYIYPYYNTFWIAIGGILIDYKKEVKRDPYMVISSGRFYSG